MTLFNRGSYYPLFLMGIVLIKSDELETGVNRRR